MHNAPLLVLIDGSSYFYRAFHALPPLVNSKGQPTGAVYGVINMIKRLIKEHPSEHIAVIFDAKGENFRHQLYDKYKAHRPPMPDDLKCQFEPMIALIKAMGLPIIVAPDVEADDVIATLAAQAEKQGFKILISTGDKDLAQLVNEHTMLINTMTQTHFDRSVVIEKFGIPPENIADYLSLVGDTSDNIPGVSGVGPKTAVQWLKNYKSIDNLIAHAHDIKGKVGDTLRNSIEQLILSRQLTALKRDIDLDITLDDLKPKAINQEQWLDCIQRLEFKSWIKAAEKENIPKSIATNDNTNNQATLRNHISTQYTTILTQALFNTWLEKLQTASYFVIDTETTSLEIFDAELVGLSFSIQTGEAIYIPLGHNYIGVPEQLDKNDVLSSLRPILENPAIKKIGQNLKYDANILKNCDIHLQGIQYDTMLESYMYNSVAGRHDMDTLALKYLSYKTVSFEEIAGKGARKLTFNQIDLEKAGFYACEDADITFRLHKHLWPLVNANTKMTELFQTVEMPLVSILAKMEYHGVLIDANLLRQQSQQLAERLNTLEAEAYILADEEFNLQSPKQLQNILFEKLKLPIKKKTPKGQPSTGEEVLQELAFDYLLPKVILEYRGLSKLKSTYTDVLPSRIHTKTGRLHTSYNQAVTSTGRLSSSHPNLQNIPIRTEEGRRVRQAFVAPEGYQLLSADYSQIELRVMAHLSQDPNLLHAFSVGLDIHQATAAEVNGISLEKVTPEQRRQAKATNFGLLYGMSSFGLAKQLGISRDAAQRYIDVYFSRYPKVLEFMENTRQFAKQHSYVETILGRRMPVPDIHSNNGLRKKAAERAAINAPLQGSAADIIKLAMIQSDCWIRESNPNVNMIMQVHDELVFEIKNNDLTEAKLSIKQLMESALSLSVPLVVSMGTGKNWDEAH